MDLLDGTYIQGNDPASFQTEAELCDHIGQDFQVKADGTKVFVGGPGFDPNAPGAKCFHILGDLSPGMYGAAQENICAAYNLNDTRLTTGPNAAGNLPGQPDNRPTYTPTGVGTISQGSDGKCYKMDQYGRPTEEMFCPGTAPGS